MPLKPIRQIVTEFRIFALLALAFFPSQTWAAAELIQLGSSSQLSGPLATYVEQAKLPLLDPNHFPEVFQTAPQLLALIDRIHGVHPLSEKVLVIIMDRSSPEAYVKELPSGEIVISLSAGLLRFVQNDHELAFILSHEMEHPNSRLEHNFAALKKELPLNEKTRPWAERLIGRSAETEIDLRGIYYRMLGAGFNPYAAEAVLDRLVDLYGDALSDDHTSTRSRRDAISLSIAAMRRNQGRQMTPSDHYEDNVTRPLRAFLSSPAFLNRQRARIEYFLDNLNLDIDSFFNQVRANQTLQSKKLPYREVYEPLQENILRLARYYFTDAETQKFLVALHTKVDDAFIEAHQRFLRENPTWKSATQASDYLSLLRRSFRTFLPDLPQVMARIIELENKINTTKNMLAKASEGSEQSSRLQSRLRQLEKAMKKEVDHRVAAQLAFGTLPEHLFETLRLNSQKEGPSAWETFEAALHRHRIDLGSRYLRSVSDTVTYLSTGIRNTFARAVAFDQYSLRHLSNILPQATLRDIHSEAWFLFVQELQTAIKNSDKDHLAKIERLYFRNSWFSFPVDTLEAAFKQEPARAIEQYKRLIATVLEAPTALKSRLLVLRELVFSSSIKLPHSTRQQMLSQYIKPYIDLLGETFLETQLGLQEPESALRALKEYHRVASEASRITSQVGPVYISPEPFMRATRALQERAASNGAPVPDTMLILQDSSLLELLVSHARPSRETIWKDFLSLPTEELAAAQRYYRRISFSNAVALFDGFIPRAELFQALYQRRSILEFDGGDLINDSQNQTRTEVRRAFFKYFRNRDPNDVRFAAKVLGKLQSGNRSFAPDTVSDLREGLFLHYLDSLRETERGLNLRLTTTRILDALQETFSHPWGTVEVTRILMETQEKWLPASVSDRLELALAVLERSMFLRDAQRSYSLESLDPNHFLTTEQQRNEASLPLLIEYWRHYSGNIFTRGRSTDELFETIWRRTELEPRLRENLTDPKLVGNLHFDDVRFTLAEWQLKRILNDQRSTRSRTGVRAEVKLAMELLKAQIDEANLLRNRLIAVIENTLVTNEEETKFLSDYRQSIGDPKPSRGVLLVDSIHHVTKLAQSNFQKLEAIYYLTGRTNQPPSFLPKDFAGTAISIRRHYWSAGIAPRGYAIQSLLDSKEGILSEPATTERLYQLLLGENLNVPVIRAMFESYLESLPLSEKVVLLSQAVAHLSPKDKKGLGLKTILEFMGPLGIKVGQFLRTSGLVNREVGAELDGFLDRALPPERPEIFSRFRDVFGELMQNIEVGGLIGSGSVNYVVLAKFHVSGAKNEWVAVRFSRPEAVGKVQNENQIWINAIRKLRESDAPEATRSADIIQESRLHAMSTLSPEGAEFNLELERNNYAQAAKAYQSGRDTRTGLTITALKPDKNLQLLVPRSFSRSVTIMEYIDHTSLSSLSPYQRQIVIEQILRAEFEALFERGLFDPDGHPGNWLNYLAANRLVRIDYAQIRSATKEQRESLKTVLRLLVQFDFSKSAINKLTHHLGSIFESNIDYNKHHSIVARLVRSERFPPSHSPHERILYLREGLEKNLAEAGIEVDIRLNSFVRAALSSLGRTLGFRDQMTKPARYQELLLDAIGTSRLQVGARSLFGKAQGYLYKRVSREQDASATKHKSPNTESRRYLPKTITDCASLLLRRTKGNQEK